jgi:hypothetical protein
MSAADVELDAWPAGWPPTAVYHVELFSLYSIHSISPALATPDLFKANAVHTDQLGPRLITVDVVVDAAATDARDVVILMAGWF